MTMRMAARLPARLVEVDLLRTVDRLFFRTLHTFDTRASNEGFRRLREDFTITEKAPTRAFSRLQVPICY